MLQSPGPKITCDFVKSTGGVWAAYLISSSRTPSYLVQWNPVSFSVVPSGECLSSSNSVIKSYLWRTLDLRHLFILSLHHWATEVTSLTVFSRLPSPVPCTFQAPPSKSPEATPWPSRSQTCSKYFPAWRRMAGGGGFFPVDEWVDVICVPALLGPSSLSLLHTIPAWFCRSGVCFPTYM